MANLRYVFFFSLNASLFFLFLALLIFDFLAFLYHLECNLTFIVAFPLAFFSLTISAEFLDVLEKQFLHIVGIICDAVFYMSKIVILIVGYYDKSEFNSLVIVGKYLRKVSQSWI